MPLSPQALDQPEQTIDLQVDARWTMAYAAGVPDDTPALYDTDRPTGPVVHPLFPVAAEWQLITSMRAANTGLTPDEVRRGIHIAHDLMIEHPIPARMPLHIAARTIAIGQRRAGATQTIEFTASNTDTVLWRTRMTSLYLGVALDGSPSEVGTDWPAPPPPPQVVADRSERTWVRPVDAHVYSECARIWNPIHTDVVAARHAGLAAPVLHGTATVARAISIAARLWGVPLNVLRRVSCDFSAPVLLDTSLTVVASGSADNCRIDVTTLLDDGSSALRNAWFTYASATT